VPGLGHASPIVFGDKVFTVSAVPETEERLLLCIERNTGQIAWRQTVVKSSLERKHSLNSHASSTPACDGERVFVAFLDRVEMVVAAYDLNGKQQWLVRPGVCFHARHGSPILFNDKVIVNGDHDGDGYIVALDRRTGRKLWRIDRPSKTAHLHRAAYSRNRRAHANGSHRQVQRTTIEQRQATGSWMADGAIRGVARLQRAR
jgi:outer membrane protein assembly factor BamB